MKGVDDELVSVAPLLEMAEDWRGFIGQDITGEERGISRSHERTGRTSPVVQHFRFLTSYNLAKQAQKLIRKQNDNAKHRMLGYLAVPLDHDVAGAEVFFKSAVC
ncbi:MAG: hypothetical protein WA121_12125 [Syntrophales bacterium]